MNRTASQEKMKNSTGHLRYTFGETTPKGFPTRQIKQIEESESDLSNTNTTTACQEDTNALNEANAHCVSHFHALMYIQAEYFQIDSLKTKAKRYFCESFLHELDRSSFEATITDIYNLTIQSDQGLREMTVKLIMEYLPDFRARTILSDELLKQLPNFAADLCIAMISYPPSGGRVFRLVDDWD